jgi:hypothetical protein
MTENAAGKSTPTPPRDSQIDQMVEALLGAEFSMFLLSEALTHSLRLAFRPSENASPHAPEEKARLEARRMELLALPPQQLRDLYLKHLAQQKAEQERAQAQRKAAQEAKAAKKEAAKFYNLPSAVADLEYWSKHEFWTFDESVALLLGKDPNAVKWAAVKRELSAFKLDFDAKREPAEFLRRYERLRNLALRAQAMTRTARLRPIDVLAWAENSGAVQAPARLVECVTHDIKRLIARKKAAEAATTAALKLPEASVPTGGEAPGTKVRWTDEALAQLRAYKEQHGTKAAAEQFRISAARVRALLPQPAPKNTSP